MAVAVDESAEAVQPWVDEAKATYPVLIDSDHKFVDAYGIRNVPTVVWIDEDDQIVRPNSPEFGDDKFIDFHGQPSVHIWRRWSAGSSTARSRMRVPPRCAPTSTCPTTTSSSPERSIGWPSSFGGPVKRD